MKRYCPKGHDKYSVGVTKHRQCARCASRNRKTRSDKGIMKRPICPYGHDKRIVGRTNKGECRECKRQRDRERDWARSASPEQRQLKRDRDKALRENMTVEQREAKRRQAVALRRAQARLADNHPEEYGALYDEELQRVADEVMVGVVTVPEHERYVFGRPVK